MTHQERAQRREQAANDVHNGLSYREAAIRYGVSTTYVREAYRVFYPDGHKPKKDLPRASKTIRIVGQLLRTRDNLNTISDRVGTAYQRVQDVYAQLRSEGVEFPERN